MCERKKSPTVETAGGTRQEVAEGGNMDQLLRCAWQRSECSFTKLSPRLNRGSCRLWRRRLIDDWLEPTRSAICFSVSPVATNSETIFSNMRTQ